MAVSVYKGNNFLWRVVRVPIVDGFPADTVNGPNMAKALESANSEGWVLEHVTANATDLFAFLRFAGINPS